MKLVLLRIRWMLITTLCHLAIISVSLAFAVWIRFDFSLGPLESSVLLAGLIIVVPIKIVAFFAGGLHRGWWRYAGLTDLARIVIVNVVASGMSTITLFICFGAAFPRSVYVIDFLVCFLLTAGSRFCVRFYNETLKSELTANGKGILIYGAGGAAELFCGKLA